MSILPVETADFDLELPVAVIGAGACGLTAAITAAEAGAEVYVFEQDASPAGSTAMSYGSICAAGTETQAGIGIDDTAEALVEDILTATRGKAPRTLARQMARESGPTIDWFTKDLGFTLTVEVNWKGFGHRCPRLHGTPNRSGPELVAMLLGAAEERGVTVITQAKVTTLLVNPDGVTIGGFIYESPDGKVTVGCDALILASSGYAANEALVSQHIPSMKNAYFYGHEGHMGDALLWGEALGARTGDLGGHQALGALASPENFIVPHTLLVDGGVQVNRAGRRFENELTDISGQAKRIIQQKDALCWMVYDQKGHDKADRIFAEYRDAAITSPYKSANTAEGLASLLGVDPAGLAKTFAELDALITSGETDEFGRVFSEADRLEPPYYAMRVTGALFHTQGGLCVDSKARVRKLPKGSFTNLFAGGGAARSISGPAEWGYLPGAGLMSAVTLGRIAGREAATLVKS